MICTHILLMTTLPNGITLYIKGVTIGAQDYLGGVYDSEKDAMKNSDYGAMWMLAKLTDDPRLTQKKTAECVEL